MLEHHLATGTDPLVCCSHCPQLYARSRWLTCQHEEGIDGFRQLAMKQREKSQPEIHAAANGLASYSVITSPCRMSSLRHTTSSAFTHRLR